MRSAPYREGERVHFRPLEDILTMLEVGYLELEYALDGTTRYQVLRKIGDMYRLSASDASELPRYAIDQPQLIDLVESQGLDLHAFRWYPTLASSALGSSLPKSVSHLLGERIDDLLEGPLSAALLVDAPKEVSKCNH